MLGVWLHDVAMGGRKFEAGILRPGRLPGQSLIDAGRGNAIAEEYSESLNFGERHAAAGDGVAGEAARLQFLCAAYLFQVRRRGQRPARCDVQYSILWLVISDASIFASSEPHLERELLR
jgi:hypothetical protein